MKLKIRGRYRRLRRPTFKQGMRVMFAVNLTLQMLILSKGGEPTNLIQALFWAAMLTGSLK